MIKVCDAIMGSGKSQSCISYMNEHPEKRFVYITPYLGEASRIKDGCPTLDFKEPDDKILQFEFSKLKHTEHLLRKKQNITTTHVAFRSYTKELVDAIRDGGYTLIVDEAVDTFKEAGCSDGDLRLLADAGCIRKIDDIYVLGDNAYDGGRLSDLYRMFQCNNIEQVTGEKKNNKKLYYWTLPVEVLQAFEDVMVLTYLFESQDLKYYLDIHKMDYKFIGIRRDGDCYNFVDEVDYVPNYVKSLGDVIHVFDNSKLNSVGKNKNALSANWLRTNHDGVDALKKNLYNFIRNYNPESQCKDVMWGTLNDRIGTLRGRGFSNQHVPFNMKATNEYRDRNVLAYCVNVFTSPAKINFFARYGIKYDADLYAISTMVQWIWRSAIRDGQEISIYVPSKRMRDLLKEWINQVSIGGSINGQRV